MIIREIFAHASAEERHVYLLFRANLPNGNTIADNHIMDDVVNKEIMQMLENMDPHRDDDLYDHTVQKLIMVEKNHFTEEEFWFNTLRDKLSPDYLANLEEIIIKAKEEAPLHPHPGGSAKPSAGANVIQPMIGKVERMFDSK